MEFNYQKTAAKAHKILDEQIDALARLSEKSPLGSDEILRLEILVKTLAVLAEKLKSHKKTPRPAGDRISDEDLESYARGK